MRNAAVAVLFALSILSAGSARAQTPVLVDRDALARKLREYHQQVEALQQQVMQLGPRGPQAMQMQAGFQSLREQLGALERDIRSLPVASQAGTAQMPAVVVTTTTPTSVPVVVPVQPGYPPPPPHHHHGQPNYPPPGYPNQPPPGYPPPAPSYQPPAPAYQTIPDETFNALVDSIEDQSFSADKIRTLQEGIGPQYVLVSHVERILPLFSFSADKLRALELMAPRIVDRQNNFKVYNLFTFSGDKEKARRILSR